MDEFSKKLQLYTYWFAILGIPICLFNILTGDYGWYNYVGLVCYPITIYGALSYKKELEQRKLKDE